MKLRRADSTDNAIIAEIYRLAFIHSFRNEDNAVELDQYVASLDKDYFAQRLVSADETFLVAETEDGQVMGFAQLTSASPYPDSKGSWFKLERLYVYPDKIGQGLGTLLMDGFQHEASDQGATNLWLLVLRSNLRAIEFYGRYGFEVFDRSPAKFKADHELDLWMSKSISR